METTIAKSADEKWFDELVASLRTDQLLLETGTADKEKKEFYQDLISGNPEQLFRIQKELSKKYFISKIIMDFVSLLDRELPNVLAFDFNDSEVLCWIEINDDDEQMEDKLITAEAKINAKYHDNGYDMESIIVESSEKIKVPKHYAVLKS